MRYADAYTQQRLERVTTGRPLDSPGWGMLQAVKTTAYISQRDPTNHTTIEAGKTRVARDYWLAVERPEWFKPADKRDARTYREHRASLERARRELERTPIQTPASRTRSKGVLPRKGVLPASPPFRLPRAAPSTRVLP